jgi:hypothetical protein
MEGGTGIHTPIPQNITFDAGTAVTVTATVTGGTTLFIGAAWNYV